MWGWHPNFVASVTDCIWWHFLMMVGAYVRLPATENDDPGSSNEIYRRSVYLPVYIHIYIFTCILHSITCNIIYSVYLQYLIGFNQHVSFSPWFGAGTFGGGAAEVTLAREAIRRVVISTYLYNYWSLLISKITLILFRINTIIHDFRKYWV